MYLISFFGVVVFALCSGASFLMTSLAATWWLLFHSVTVIKHFDCETSSLFVPSATKQG